MTPLPVVLRRRTGGTALWYLTRASGVVALVLLTATVVLGSRRLGRVDHGALAPLPLPGRPPQPVAAVPGLRRRPRRHHRGRRLRAHRPGRRLRPLPLAVPSPLGRARRPLPRPAAGRAGDQRAPSPHRLRLLAVRPLAGLPVLADRPAPRAGHRIGHPLGPVLAVDAACTAAVLAVVAWRLPPARTLGATPAPGRGRRGGGGDRGHRRVRRPRTAAPRLVAPVGHLEGTAGPDRRQATPASPPPATRGRRRRPHHGAAVGSGRATACRAPAAPFTVSRHRHPDHDVPIGSGQVRITLALHLEDAAVDPADHRARRRGRRRRRRLPLRRDPSPSGPTTARSPRSTGTRSSPPSRATGPLDLTVTLGVDQRTGALSGTVSGPGRAGR